jgi:hypothetical protein
LPVTVVGPVSIDREQTVEPDWNKPECSGAKSHDEADLCQQRRMAKAAEDTVLLNKIQIGLGLVGACLLFWTLYEGRRAGNAATRAANAAGETIRVMRNAERPYFTIFDPELRDFAEAVRDKDWGRVLKAHLDVWNIGKGVGFLQAYGIAHEICPEGKQGDVTLIEWDIIGRMPVSADAKLDTNLPYHVFQISDAEREAILSDRKNLYLYGFLRYSDLFGVVRRTGFIFEFVAYRNSPENSVFVMCRHPMWYDTEEHPKHQAAKPRWFSFGRKQTTA